MKIINHAQPVIINVELVLDQPLPVIHVLIPTEIKIITVIV